MRTRTAFLAVASVFLDDDCSSDSYFSLRPNGGRGSDRLLLRSVIFG